MPLVLRIGYGPRVANQRSDKSTGDLRPRSKRAQQRRNIHEHVVVRFHKIFRLLAIRGNPFQHHHRLQCQVVVSVMKFFLYYVVVLEALVDYGILKT